MGGVGGKPDLLDQEGTNMGGSQHAPRRRANQHDALSRSSTSICSHTRIYVYIYGWCAFGCKRMRYLCPLSICRRRLPPQPRLSSAVNREVCTRLTRGPAHAHEHARKIIMPSMLIVTECAIGWCCGADDRVIGWVLCADDIMNAEIMGE